MNLVSVDGGFADAPSADRFAYSLIALEEL